MSNFRLALHGAYIFVVFLFLFASATIINIPADYPTIQEGIDASADGDTVLVNPGTYFENINFNGHNIVLGSLFLTSGDTSYIGQTVIDGDSAGSVVTFESGEDSTTLIIGFSITNGRADRGGGIFCSHSSPTISHNEIFENETPHGWTNGGAGICCLSSAAWLSFNHIHDNAALYADGEGTMGGGIKSENSALRILNNVIANNSSSIAAAIAVEDTFSIIKYNHIFNNYAP